MIQFKQKEIYAEKSIYQTKVNVNEVYMKVIVLIKKLIHVYINLHRIYCVKIFYIKK